MDKLTLADIQALAASVDYGGDGNISPSSAALGLSAALFLSNLSLWQGAGYNLTDGEIDDIKAMIAGLECDLMLSGGGFLVHTCKVRSNIPQTIANTGTDNVEFEVELYDDYGMHEAGANNHLITVVEEGYYIITAQVTWNAQAVGSRQLWLTQYRIIEDDNIRLALSLARDVTGTSQVTQKISAQTHAEIGDTFRLGIKQTSVLSIDLVVEDHIPSFSVTKVGRSG